MGPGPMGPISFGWLLIDDQFSGFPPEQKRGGTRDPPAFLTPGPGPYMDQGPCMGPGIKNHAKQPKLTVFAAYACLVKLRDQDQDQDEGPRDLDEGSRDPETRT